MGLVTRAPSHTTTTVPAPGRVFVPITHVQLAMPAESADLGPSPCAVLAVPAGVV